MVVVLLLELHDVPHVQLGRLLQALGAQSQQLLQAAQEAPVEPLQLLAAPRPLTLAADVSESPVQVGLHVDGRHQEVRRSALHGNTADQRRATHLQPRGLKEERRRQLLLLLQQAAHLRHLLLQRLLHVDHSLGGRKQEGGITGSDGNVRKTSE